MARVRISNGRSSPTCRPAPQRRPQHPLRSRQARYEEPEEEYDDEAGSYEELHYEPETGASYYDDEPEEESPPPRRRPVRPRAPIHGARVRGHREQRHETSHGEPRRIRRRKSTAVEDIYYIPVEEIPEGSSYEWKRWSVVGAEDPFYIAQMREQGWEPVDPRRHPTWVPPGYSLPHIIKGGMILMERPIELTEEARAEQRVLARQQVREAEARLGRTPGNTHQRLAPKITKEIMRAVQAEE